MACARAPAHLYRRSRAIRR